MARTRRKGRRSLWRRRAGPCRKEPVTGNEAPGETMMVEIEDKEKDSSPNIEILIVAAACVIAAIICTYIVYTAM